MPRRTINTRSVAARRKCPLTHDQRARITTMYEAGLRPVEIARRMNASFEHAKVRTIESFIYQTSVRCHHQRSHTFSSQSLG